MRLVRVVLALDQPQEVRFFLFLAAFGAVITAIYWFVSYEAAGTFLLGGYTVATGVLGARLAADPAARRVRRRAGSVPARRRAAEVAEPRDAPGGGTGGIDRPFLDERGRLPDETVAPLAVGLGVAVAATGAIFGPAPIVVGILPLAWGAWAWFRGASEEFEAGVLDDVAPDRHEAAIANGD